MDENELIENLQYCLMNLDQLRGSEEPPKKQQIINDSMINAIHLLTNLCLAQYNHILYLENYLKQKDII